MLRIKPSQTFGIIFPLLFVISFVVTGCSNSQAHVPEQTQLLSSDNPPQSVLIPDRKDVITICSWNLKDFGKSKTPEAIAFMARTITNADIVAIQEVVAAPGGAKAVAQLADELNRTGSKWDYAISDPTTATTNGSQERYAFLWKPSRIRFKKGSLAKEYETEIEREPFMGNFHSNQLKCNFTLVSFHAVPKSKHPEQEIKLLKSFPTSYKDAPLIFTGDFNCPESHTVFNGLKQAGFTNTLTSQKTSLRHKCLNEDCLASEYDNFFIPSSTFDMVGSGVVHFYKTFPDIKAANKISDHIPIYVQMKPKN